MALLYRSVAYTTTGTKDSVNLDPSIAPFAVTIGVNVGTTATYGMQFSLDPMDVSDANAIWYDSGDIPTGTTTSATSFILSPVSRVRLVIAAVSGTLTLQTQQGFSVN